MPSPRRSPLIEAKLLRQVGDGNAPAAFGHGLVLMLVSLARAVACGLCCSPRFPSVNVNHVVLGVSSLRDPVGLGWPGLERFDRRTLFARAGRLALGASAALAVQGSGASLARAARSGRLQQLRRGFSGRVVSRADRGYRRARRLFNAPFDAVKPTAVAFCETVADVRKTVRWAKRHGVRIAARSGGHSYGGYSSTRGLVVDVGRLDQVVVDVDASTALVGAGSRLIDVYAALWEQGVAIPAGSCPSVGIAGLALGGGHGFSSRKFGLTCDSLLAATMVSAAGKVVRCSASENEDLFWALRGGVGGNFGIVTDLTFRVHPVNEVATFRVQWPWEQAAIAVDAWQAFAPLMLPMSCSRSSTCVRRRGMARACSRPSARPGSSSGLRMS